MGPSDAGIEFLRETWTDGVNGWTLCFFSSRSRHKLEKSIKEVTGGSSPTWLQKPVDVEAVINQLRKTETEMMS